MAVEILESCLRERWPTHPEPTRHLEGPYGLVFVLEASHQPVVPRKFCVKTLDPEKLQPGGRVPKRLFERAISPWRNVPFHCHVLTALGLEFLSPPAGLAGEFEALPLVRMPFCEGNLSACVRGEIAMSPVDRLIVLAQTCSGLRWLYEHGVQGHGDLKPGNILLSDLRARFALPDREGFPSKTHFWQARVADPGWADIWIECGGTSHAWRPYLAPERFDATAASEPSDIFAVGVVACELLCGQHPAGDATEILATEWDVAKWVEWATSGPRHLDELLPESLREVIDRALAPDPSHRPAASDLQSALCDILEQDYGLNLALQLAVQDRDARQWRDGGF